MSRPTREDDHSAYAPKWARNPNHKRSPGIAEGEFSQDSEAEDLSGNQTLVPDLIDTRNFEAPERAPLTRRSFTEAEQREVVEQPLSERELFRLRRSLEPDFVKEPRSAPQARWRLAALTGWTIAAALIGAAILLFITDGVPHQWKTMSGLSADMPVFMSRFAGDTLKNSEQPRTTSSPPIALAAPQPTNVATTQVATIEAPSGSAPSIRGVTNSEVRFGISAPFTGAAKELGNQMKLGIETAFNLANDAGGVAGRQVKLAVADDGYEPTRTADTMRQLYEKQQVFGFVGNVGTPTAVVALPYALERHALFFGAFTGADLLRRDPPDRYVFNYRASYAEETDAVVRYLVKMRHLRPEQIAVFAQHDAFGDAGFAGVARAMRALGGNSDAILRLDYERNTVDVVNAVADLHAHKTPIIQAVVMVAAYRAAAKFIEKTRDLYPSMFYTNVSFVGSTALAGELMLLGPRYANGVIVTQVVPAVDSYSSAILKYRTALAKYFPGEAPDYVSLEGYVDGTLLLEGLRRAGPKLDTETLADTLETLRNFDMGLGTLINFGQSEHQGSHKVWATQLDDHGHYQPVDLQ
jgi:branched-chain amino acid transport system substrate-binding protein